MSQRHIHPTATSAANLHYTDSTAQWFWGAREESNTLHDGEQEDEASADGGSPRWRVALLLTNAACRQSRVISTLTWTSLKAQVKHPSRRWMNAVQTLKPKKIEGHTEDARVRVTPPPVMFLHSSVSKGMQVPTSKLRHYLLGIFSHLNKRAWHLNQHIATRTSTDNPFCWTQQAHIAETATKLEVKTDIVMEGACREMEVKCL